MYVVKLNTTAYIFFTIATAICITCHKFRVMFFCCFIKSFHLTWSFTNLFQKGGILSYSNNHWIKQIRNVCMRFTIITHPRTQHSIIKYLCFSRVLQDGTLTENGIVNGSKIILTPNVETGLVSFWHFQWFVWCQWHNFLFAGSTYVSSTSSSSGWWQCPYEFTYK